MSRRPEGLVCQIGFVCSRVAVGLECGIRSLEKEGE